MILPKRTNFVQVPSRASEFLWATGIEDTFIIDPHPKTGRTLDEYELTDHYRQWEEDIERVAELGVPAVRYGIPWYRLEPEPGRFDWSWTDRVLSRIVQRGIEPIIDLIHYGTPRWLTSSFLNPEYPERVSAYAAAFARQYRGLFRWLTPLNEPRINAWYAGRVGQWPPYRRSWTGFAQVLLAICRGIVETEAAVRAVIPDFVSLHVDPTDLYVTDDPSLQPEARVRQELVFLALDLVLGRVGEAHPLREWLRRRRIRDEDVAWFQTHQAQPAIIGLNEYPMFSLKRLVRGRRGIRQVMPCASPSVLAELCRMYYRRYRMPVMITETAAMGSVSKRAAWMDGSIEVVRELRSEGVPLVGYTWWPLFALISWPYRVGTQPLENYLIQMGLWELLPSDGRLERVRTPLVDRYRRYIASVI
jgi:beta-glucosidase/6-phospho-beta-glucosidase/beta-galactosidase